jgi:large subunit ribosomal protein L25
VAQAVLHRQEKGLRPGVAEFIGREDVVIMEEITLTAQPREVLGKQVRQMRRAGLIPAVVYGHRTAPQSLQIDEKELRTLLQHAGANQLIKLQIGDAVEPRMVLVRGVQREPIKRRLLHVDLFEVVMTETIHAAIPIFLVGFSPIVKRGDALLHHGLEQIEVECLPGDLIPHIEVDLSPLAQLNQEVKVRDLKLGDKINVLSSLDDVVVRVIAIHEEKVEEAVPAAEGEVEVAKKPEEAAGAEAAKA